MLTILLQKYKMTGFFFFFLVYLGDNVPVTGVGVGVGSGAGDLTESANCFD